MDSAVGAIGGLLPSIRGEVERRDTTYPVFHGAYDWHSSVHAHWALLRAYECVGDAVGLAWIRARIESSDLVGEFEYLRTHENFELPYGRAWLIRMLLTHETMTGQTLWRTDCQEIADGLWHWLRHTGTGPDTPEYENCSWVLAQLYAWTEHIGDAQALRRLEDLSKARFLSTELSLDRDSSEEFFSRWGLQMYVIYRTLGGPALNRWLAGNGQLNVDAKPLETFLSAHSLGVNASRAWGFWAAYLATGNTAWKRAYERHVRASLALHEVWQAERYSYTHWVPQFTIYALVLPFDLPEPQPLT